MKNFPSIRSRTAASVRTARVMLARRIDSFARKIFASLSRKAREDLLTRNAWLLTDHAFAMFLIRGVDSLPEPPPALAKIAESGNLHRAITAVANSRWAIDARDHFKKAVMTIVQKRTLGDDAEAQDVLAEASLNIISRQVLDKLETNFSRAKTMIFRLIDNTATDIWRRNQRHEDNEAVIPTDEEGFDLDLVDKDSEKIEDELIQQVGYQRLKLLLNSKTFEHLIEEKVSKFAFPYLKNLLTTDLDHKEILDLIGWTQEFSVQAWSPAPNRGVGWEIVKFVKKYVEQRDRQIRERFPDTTV